MQGQDHPGAVTSVALRTTTRDRAAVVAALDAGEVVTSWPVRGTLHLVAAADLAWLRHLGAPRPSAAAAARRPALGLTGADVEHAAEVAATALAGRSLPRADVLEAWRESGLDPDGGRGSHLLRQLAVDGLLCLGPVTAGRQQVVLVSDWIGPTPEVDHDAAVDTLVQRYFAGHGPATVADLVRWAGVTVRDVRAGLARVGGSLARLDVDGTPFWLDPATPDRLSGHRRAARGLLLLPGFDEMVLGYADRTATLPAEHADAVVPGANGVFRPTVVHGGRASGTWREVGSGRTRRLEATPFTTFPAAVERGLAGAQARLPLR